MSSLDRSSAAASMSGVSLGAMLIGAKLLHADFVEYRTIIQELEL